MMRNLSIAALAAFAFAAPAAAAGSEDAPGQDRVCLITWGSAADAATGADATALSGKYLPRKAAEAQAAKSDGKSRTFDYSNTTQTGADGTVTIDSNEEERAFCEGATFNPSLRD